MDRVIVNTAPQRGLVCLHVGDQMIEMTPFDAEDLGRKIIDNANDCLIDPAYISADDAPVQQKLACTTCGHDRVMHRIDGPDGADYSVGCGVPLCGCSGFDKP